VFILVYLSVADNANDFPADVPYFLDSTKKLVVIMELPFTIIVLFLNRNGQAALEVICAMF
jgi:hypothetical protein